jgi:hypothetical protein
MPAPRYLSPNASRPMLSFRDAVTDREARNAPGGFVRWKVCSTSGHTLAASEWRPNVTGAIAAVERDMKQVSNEQDAAFAAARLGLSYRESL